MELESHTVRWRHAFREGRQQDTAASQACAMNRAIGSALRTDYLEREAEMNSTETILSGGTQTEDAAPDTGVRAETVWVATDIIENWRPEWTHAEAEAWLRDHRKYIQDSMISAGGDCIDDLIGAADESDAAITTEP